MNSCAISWIKKSNCVACITCFAHQTFSCDLCKINKFLMYIIWAIQHDVFISMVLGTRIQHLLTFFWWKKSQLVKEWKIYFKQRLCFSGLCMWEHPTTESRWESTSFSTNLPSAFAWMSPFPCNFEVVFHHAKNNFEIGYQ